MEKIKIVTVQGNKFVNRFRLDGVPEWLEHASLMFKGKNVVVFNAYQHKMPEASNPVRVENITPNGDHLLIHTSAGILTSNIPITAMPGEGIMHFLVEAESPFHRIITLVR
jgi:hypothetical protein